MYIATAKFTKLKASKERFYNKYLKFYFRYLHPFKLKKILLVDLVSTNFNLCHFFNTNVTKSFFFYSIGHNTICFKIRNDLQMLYVSPL